MKRRAAKPRMKPAAYRYVVVGQVNTRPTMSRHATIGAARAAAARFLVAVLAQDVAEDVTERLHGEPGHPSELGIDDLRLTTNASVALYTRRDWEAEHER